VPLALTISRQTYSRSHEMAEELIRLLDKDSILGKSRWALFDRDLVHKILEDHHLPKTLARYMPEDRDHDLYGVINEILGVHPSLWDLFHHTCDTIHKLALTGNVILIGRGAHIVTRNLPHVVHVRVVSPMEKRVENAVSTLEISHQVAAKRLLKEDQTSNAFIRSHFDELPENPLAYHMTLNLGQMNPVDAAGTIHAFMKRSV